MENEYIELFQCLFRGRRDVWGSVKGKCNKEPVTDNHFKLHLEGNQSLGIYPLLDDGTCHFAAIDLDEKNFNKALAIRQELVNNGIYAHIAESKSKGFHIYIFADDKFVAKDIRRVCHWVLDKLGTRAEVFPKQDKLDDLIPYGNYINLPCFGATRPFLTVDLKEVPLDTLNEKVKFNFEEPVVRLCQRIPEPQPIVPKTVATGSTVKSKKPPPCIGKLLNGIGAGARDEAAFAIARHYLDQQYTAEEVLGLLMTWDKNNKPPLNDERLLETKLRSAEKGYAFGCSSITGNPLLADFCVGEDKCDWQRAVYKERLKKGLVKEASFWETDSHMYEQVIQDGRPCFVAYNKETRQIEYVPSIDLKAFSVRPINTPELEIVSLPNGVEEYGNTLQLVSEIQQFVYDYVDLPGAYPQFATWYILLSWVYDKMNTIGYLRFKGDTGCGKSRALDVFGTLCYKPMMLSGATTPAPIYRLIRRFRGTLILEEADFKDSDEKSEVVTILNCGYEKRRPVVRCRKENPDSLEILPCFGPKVFATRQDFIDVALEARCMTFLMQETDRDDIPPILGATYQKRAMNLRNKLLLWRLHTYPTVDPSVIEELDIGPLEPRVKQLGLPFAVPFKDYPDIMTAFRGFLKEYNRELVEKRSEVLEGHIVRALFSMFKQYGTNSDISSQSLSEYMSEHLKVDVKSNTIGKHLKTLGVKRENRRGGGTRSRFVVWEAAVMRKLLRRYIPETEEFEELFTPDMDLEI